MPRRPKTDPNTDFANLVNEISNANTEIDLAPAHPTQNQSASSDLLDDHFTYTCKVERFEIGTDNSKYEQLMTDGVNGKINIIRERFVDTKEGKTFCVLVYLVPKPKLLKPAPPPL
jgi:hypothetical protein